MKIRPALVGGSGVTVIQLATLALPTSGAISATTNLGISWANPSDHTQQLSAPKFDFTAGFGYNSLLPYGSATGKTYVNAGSGFAGTNPTLKYEFFLVDQSGVDTASLGTNTFDPTGGGGSTYYGQFSFARAGLTTPGNGIRCQITTVGTISVNIPAAWVFQHT